VGWARKLSYSFDLDEGVALLAELEERGPLSKPVSRVEDLPAEVRDKVYAELKKLRESGRPPVGMGR